MCRGKTWTREEKEYLEEKWGYIDIERIAQKLKRSKKAVRLKANRLNLRGATLAGEFVTAHQASKILGVDWHAITDYWIGKLGLKAVKQNRTGNKMIWYIKLSDLMQWLKNNQDKWDTRKLELYGLGEEPMWLTEKRRADKVIPKRRFAKYTKEEDMIIKNMYKRGYTYTQIAQRINRSRCSVECRFSRI